MTSHPGEHDYRRALELVPKLAGTRDLKKILETTVKDLGEAFRAETCQVMLTNPLDPNVTSICEYRAARDEAPEFLPTFTMPLVLHGRTLGGLSLARYGELLHADEMNVMRVVLGELSDIIRGAQINDIVQRDTFRDTFLVEIGNLMAYSLGIGDALFMVVNILGKALQVSRCLFICTDETQAGWKCYEYWNQDKVQSCQEYRWPTSDSPLVAQVLLKHAPLTAYEGQQNSYVSPVQEELQFIGVKSLLGVPLRSAEATHGCVILQQCDYRRAWTRNEIDMVQNVADKVADALVKLPAEKRAREPIMQLHQRTIALPADEGKAPDAVSVRNALKGALGHQAIPSARKTPPAKPAAAPAPARPMVDPAAEAAKIAAAEAAKIAAQKAAAEQLAHQQAAAQQAQAAAANAAAQVASQAAQAAVQPPAAPSTASATGIPTITPVQSKSAANAPSATPGSAGAEGDTSFAPPPSPAKSLGSILGAAARNTNVSGEMPPPPPPAPAAASASGNGDAAKASDPYADLDFGDFGEMPDHSAGSKQRGKADATWGNLDAIKTGGVDVSLGASRASQADTIPPSAVPIKPELHPMGAPATAPAPAVAASAAPEAAPVAESAGSKWGNLDAIPSPSASPTPATSSWGDLDSIPTPKASPAPAGAWGDLDAIPTPKGGPATPVVGGWGDLDAIPAPGGGAGGTGAAVAAAPVRGGLSGMMGGKARAAAANKPFSKARQAVQAPEKPDAPPVVPEQSKEEAEAAAQAKVEKAKQKDSTSDYIFATPGLDPRMAGRIFGWIQEIEEKDGYTRGHAKQVAELAVAIAQEAGLSQKDVEVVRQAGLLHDVGKRACPPQILQKRDEELTDPELFVMMRHPIDGAELLDSFQDLKHLAEIVRAHHEEFDGNGYPQGLKGDEIPVAARVVSVANSYHSLVSPMVWGAGMPAQKAQEELVKGAGKQWDPTFVQALIQAIMAKKVPAEF